MDNEEVSEDGDAAEDPIDGEPGGECPVCGAPLYALFKYPRVQATCEHYLGETWQLSEGSGSNEDQEDEADAQEDMPTGAEPLYEALVAVRDAALGFRERSGQPSIKVASLNAEFEAVVGDRIDEYLEYGSPLTVTANVFDNAVRDTPQIHITDRMGWGPNPAAPFDMWAADPESAWHEVTNRVSDVAESLRKLEIRLRSLADG